MAGMDVVDVELRDGSTVRVRPLRPGDAEGLADLLRGLSPEARRHRFFGAVDVGRAARTMAGEAGGDRHGLVALSGIPERIVGHAEYVREPGAAAADLDA